ncbi:MAG: hypothetical protein DMF72_21630, partial [Acidobacteria bacterium]
MSAEEATNRAVLDSAAADVQLAEEQHRFEQEQAAEAGQQLLSLEQQQEQRRRSVFESMSAVTKVRGEIAQTEDHLVALAAQSSRLASDAEATSAEVEALGGRRGQVTMEFESINDSVS